jgi:hypothetical protein
MGFCELKIICNLQNSELIYIQSYWFENFIIIHIKFVCILLILNYCHTKINTENKRKVKNG